MRMQIPGMKASVPGQCSLIQLGFQDGEGIRPLVNQLIPRFPKPRNGEGADGGSLIVCLSIFVK